MKAKGKEKLHYLYKHEAPFESPNLLLAGI